ncbi:Homeobox domain-containing protein, partial [Meloidogyne graminicola]
RNRLKFTKEATDILNNYFYNNLNNYYPCETIREELAKKCGVNVNQICVWFSNKRSEYRRNI